MQVALGERGPVWETGGKPDLNRHLVKNTPYANIAALDAEEQRIPSVGWMRHNGTARLCCLKTTLCARTKAVVRRRLG